MDQGEEIRIFGKLLQDIRGGVGMSRLKLAEKVGCKYDDIRLYEKGERVMRIDRLFRILDVLGIHLSENLSDIKVYKATVRLTTLSPEKRQILLDRILSMIETAGETQEKR